MAGFLRPHAVLLGASKVVVVATVLGIGPSGLGTSCFAQGFDWFGNLFERGQPRPIAPQTRGYPGRSDTYAPPRRSLNNHRSDPSEGLRDHDAGVREKDRPPPKSPSAFVDVIGDSFGQNLAAGLDDALADRQDVAVIHLGKGSTGLVTTEFYDWPKAVDALLATKPRTSTPANDPVKREPTKTGANAPAGTAAILETDETKPRPVAAAPIDVAVMMIGSNDRQPIRVDGTMVKPGTPDWVVAYTKRVMSIDEAFQRKGVPLIWVGVPIARDDGFADDMAAFNDIYREAAAKTGAVYVDTWEAFSDDNGDFSAVGPDVNGQMTRLRTADGVYFTKAGSRKLAHFVEVHVRRALDGKITDGRITDGKITRPPIAEPSTPTTTLLRKPDIGPVSDLTAPPFSRDGQLAAATVFRADMSREPLLETSIVKGMPQPAPEGRADDLKWPPNVAPKR